MLFDLRGRGRRTTVRVLYIGLALLLGIGLVGFGIGGGFGGGGLLSAATNSESGGSANFSKQIDKYRKLTQQQPTNLSAWENLTRNLLREAGGEGYVTTNGITEKGRQIFNEVGRSWASYIALKPHAPNLELMKEMLRIYSAEGLNEPAQETQLLQSLVAVEPTNAAYYAALAEYAYKAHQTTVADLAAAKAVALAPASSRTRVKAELASVKKEVEKEGKTSSTASAEASSGAEGAIATGTSTKNSSSSSTSEKK